MIVRLAAQDFQDIGREAGDSLDGAAKEGHLLLACAESTRHLHAAQQDYGPVLAVSREGGPCP
jgi:hypothetical protein